MQRVSEARSVELDPERQAMVDQVCEALSDPWGVAPGDLGPRFGFALYVASKYGPPEIQQRIFELVEEGVTTDPDLFIGHQGHIFTRQQIGQYEGKIDYERDEATGQQRKVLRWPTGHYVTGRPCYDKREAA